MKWFARLAKFAFIVVICWYDWHRWMQDKTASIYDFVSLLVLLAAVFYVIVQLAKDLKLMDGKATQNALLFLFSLSFMLLVSEIALRIFAHNLMSYGERNGDGHYSSAYRVQLHRCDSCGPGYFFINTPNGSENFDKPEFHYLHRYNSLGLRDHAFTEQKDSNEYRILGLGDSFTEGVGTSADSTWLKQLEYMLNADTFMHRHYTTLNGGAHGSDLIFSYDLLSKCLLKYHPDMVILNLNSTDVGDIISRGVEERKEIHHGYIEGRGPWWEYFYGSSYIVRLIVMNGLHYNWELLSRREQEEETKCALHAISEKIKDFEQLARERHFSFLLVIQPLKEELKDNVLSRIDFDPAQRRIELAPYLNVKINDLHEPLNKYYWPVDGHFTTEGYRLEAQVIYNIYVANCCN